MAVEEKLSYLRGGWRPKIEPCLNTLEIAPIGTWQPNSHKVQKHLAREIKAQWDPLERK